MFDDILSDNFLGEVCSRIKYQRTLVDRFRVFLSQSSTDDSKARNEQRISRAVQEVQELNRTLERYCSIKGYNLSVVRSELL